MRNPSQNEVNLAILEALGNLPAKLVTELRAELQAKPEKPETFSFLKRKPKPKAKAKPKTKRIEIEGHPTRATWTSEMKSASRKAYMEATGSYTERNLAGILAAKAVA